VARWLRPVPRLFSAAVRSSLADQTSDPRAVRDVPNYRVEVWTAPRPLFGRMPTARSATPLEWLKVNAFKFAYNLVMKLPPNLDVASSAQESARITNAILHHELADMVDEIDERDLDADRLYEMVVVNGFDSMRTRPDGLLEYDLSFLEKYEVQPSSYPLGGKVVISQKDRRVVSVQNPGRPLVTPRDAAFRKEAFLFRASLFQWMTAVPHSTWCHGMVGPKLFLAVYETPEGHPIRTLFAPFVLDVHKNVARASFTVFGPNGVVFKAGGFSPKGVKELLDDGVRRFNVVLPTEMDLPDEIKGPILQAWDALLALCRDGFRELGVRDDDPAVRHFHDVLAKELHPRLGELPATDAAAACIFIGAVSHQVRVPRRGPLGAAGTDARARSAATALGAQLLRHQGPALRLDEVAAPAPRRGEHEGPDRDGGAHRQRRAPRVHHRVHAPRLRAPRRRPRPLHRRPPRQEGVRGVRAQDAAHRARRAALARLPRHGRQHHAVSAHRAPACRGSRRTRDRPRVAESAADERRGS